MCGYSIAWTAHQLASLYDDAGQRLFNSVILVTDRTVLDGQLQNTIQTFAALFDALDKYPKLAIGRYAAIADELLARQPNERISYYAFTTPPWHLMQPGIDQDNMRQAMNDSKGPGNFRNFYMHITDGSKDSVNLNLNLNLNLISEIAAKDDFQAIKGQTRDDQLAAHRVPLQLMGIIPNNTGGFGDVEKAASVFVANELEPLQETLSSFNDMIGQR